MTLHLFLNELSCQSTSTMDEVDAGMTRFVAMLRAVYRVRPKSALVTAERFTDIELARGVPLVKWKNSGRARDEFRYLLARENKKSPHMSVLPADAMSLTDYRHGGNPALGIGAAHLSGGLSVSLPLSEEWDGTHVTVERETLEETDDGALDSVVDQVEVQHASGPEHADTHAEWLTRAATDSIRSGKDIWAARHDLFPDLTFLPRVEGDLRSLKPAWVQPVKDRLHELQATCAEWTIRGAGEPVYKSKVTPESESRQKLCWCIDLDGEKRLFETHSRFTPGPGRMHFRLVPESSGARIAYIGWKLELPIEG